MIVPFRTLFGSNSTNANHVETLPSLWNGFTYHVGARIHHAPTQLQMMHTKNLHYA